MTAYNGDSLPYDQFLGGSSCCVIKEDHCKPNFIVQDYSEKVSQYLVLVCKATRGNKVIDGLLLNIIICPAPLRSAVLVAQS